MDKVRGAIYTRISNDPEGLELGVVRQEEDCRKLAHKHGISVEMIYTDNDISASTRSQKRRPQFEAMMSAAEDGDYEALIFYSTSRLTRRPIEYERIIDLVKLRGTQLLTVASGIVDLTTADGRAIARTMAAWDAAEAERTSERVTRAAQQRAENGYFHGGWPAFGFRVVKEVSNGRERVVAWRHDPKHARWLREAAHRVLAGESVYAITSDWHRKGRLTGKGGVWQPRTLQRALLNPAVVGKREYRGNLYDAVWSPILDLGTWDRLHSVLKERANGRPQFAAKGNKRKYVLSGLVRCADCGAVLRSMGANKGAPVGFVHPFVDSTDPKHPHHLQSESRRIAMEPLEDWVESQFLNYIDSPAVRRALRASTRAGSAQKGAAAREAAEQDRRRLEGLEDRLVDGQIDDKGYKRQRERLTGRIRENEQVLTRLDVTLPSEAPDADEVSRLWADLDNTRKREILAQFIERIEIARMPPGMATRIAPRRNELIEDYHERVGQHQAAVLDARVSIVWRF